MNDTLAALALELEARARTAEGLVELAFSIVNDTYPALQFRQALVLDARHRALTVSGLARLEEDSPYLLWLGRVWPWVAMQLPQAGGWLAPTPETLADAPADIADGWREWWPAGVLALPLRRRSGELLGWAGFLLDQPPHPDVATLLARVAPSWSYCWEMLAGKPRKSIRNRWQALGSTRRRLILLAMAILLLVPVRQTALAPAEVVALDAMMVTAALDGVIRTVHVRPNQTVRAGDPLFSLDDTTLRNRLEVARKSVGVADAELQAATQLAFVDSRNKVELAALIGRAEERRAELGAVQEQLQRITVVAPYAGVAVFGDPDDWLGRPVATGERIMLLANPEHSGMLIHLPVADAITLDVGAPVKLFLTVRPLSPLGGTITETSYQAIVTPEGIASYRLRASIDGDDARIGLRGTAKLYGKRVPLGYYLMRRPLAQLREWSGW